MYPNKKSISVIGILFTLVLMSVIVLILLVSVKKHTNFFGSFFGDVFSSSSSFNKCASYCLSSSPNDVCNYNGKNISCSVFNSVFSSTYTIDDNILSDKSLHLFGIKDNNLISTVGSSDDYKCKVYDFLDIDENNKKSLMNGIAVPSKTDIYQVVEKTLARYDNLINEVSQQENIDPCILTTIVSIESSGGEFKHSGDYVSCGITMITPSNLKKLGYCSNGEDREECCKKIANDDASALIYAARLFKSFENEVEKRYLEEYPIDKNNVFKFAYIFARYNSETCIKPSNDCSFDNCKNLKEDPFLINFNAIPQFMCAYKPEGCVETQAHVTKAIYAYNICKNLK